jgi:carotenoid cleavage dioxygenase
MERRQFLKAGLGLGAFALTGSACADTATYRSFRAALARDPELVVYASVTGGQQGAACRPTCRGRSTATGRGASN